MDSSSFEKDNNEQAPVVEHESSQPAQLTDPVTPFGEPAKAKTESVKEEKPKKKKTGLIASIIIILVLILGGSGAFAAIAIIKNQPENILGESISNLFNAKQVAINGTIEYKANSKHDEVEYNDYDLYQTTNGYNYLSTLGISSVRLTLGTEFNKTGQSDSAAGLRIDFSNGNNINLAVTEETMIKDGVIYFKVSGIQGIYDEFAKKFIDANQSPNNTLPEAELAAVTDIINLFENQWIKVSIDEVLGDELLAGFLMESNKKQIRDAYNCSMSKLYNNDAVSKELSDIYKENAFLKLTPTSDSFYKLSADFHKLTDFANATLKARFVNDYATCVGANYNSSNPNLEVPYPDDDAAKAYEESLPDVLVKFDGFLDHRLTELKFSDVETAYTANYDFTFSYPDSIMVSNPTNARPIMDVIKDAATKITTLSQGSNNDDDDYDDYDDYDYYYYDYDDYDEEDE